VNAQNRGEDIVWKEKTYFLLVVVLLKFTFHIKYVLGFDVRTINFFRMQINNNTEYGENLLKLKNMKKIKISE
jgi:hypothetical protein